MKTSLLNSCYTNTYPELEYQEHIHRNTEQYLWINSCGYCDEIPDLQPVYRPHGREDFFFSYNYSGDMFFRIQGKEYVCSAGDLLFYAPGDPQIYRYDCNNYLSNYWTHFTGFGAAQLFASLDLPAGIPYHIGYIPEIEPLTKKIISEINSKRPGSIFYANTLFAEILALVNKKKSGNLLQLNVQHGDEVYQTVQYIQEHLTQPISVGELAAMAFLSLNRYTIIFKKLLNMTPQEYIISLRLQKSMELLKNTDWTISRISGAIGYEDPLYFSRLFKKHYKISPSEYRLNTIGETVEELFNRIQ